MLQKQAKQFAVTFLDGKRFILTEHLKQKVIVINFFATWCGPCREEIPELNRFHEERCGEDVILIGVDVGEDPDRVQEFVTSRTRSRPSRPRSSSAWTAGSGSTKPG